MPGSGLFTFCLNGLFLPPCPRNRITNIISQRLCRAGEDAYGFFPLFQAGNTSVTFEYGILTPELYDSEGTGEDAKPATDAPHLVKGDC